MIRRTPLQRSTKPIPKKRAKPRRGRIVDKKYMAWIASQPGLIDGGVATVHHVRRFGEPKNDRRTIPLEAKYHLIQFGPKDSIEAIGKEEFEFRHGISLENEILKYNALYRRKM